MEIWNNWDLFSYLPISFDFKTYGGNNLHQDFGMQMDKLLAGLKLHLQFTFTSRNNKVFKIGRNKEILHFNQILNESFVGNLVSVVGCISSKAFQCRNMLSNKGLGY